MKKILRILLVLCLLSQPLVVTSKENPFVGKIIALDAGHGGEELGAQYPANSGWEGTVYEKDINLAVVYGYKQKLEENGACVVLTRECDETIPSRKTRVSIAESKCQSECGGDCDVLISVHHNGNIDPDYNGTLVIYNERQDVPLANTMLSALSPMTDNNEGFLHGGYGMTIFGHLVSVITEAYYTTNTNEADTYLAGILTNVCSDHSVLVGDRINEEVDALYLGLSNYFALPIDDKPNRSSHNSR